MYLAGVFGQSVGKQIQAVLLVRELDLPTEDNIFPKWVPFDILQSRGGDRISALVKAPSRGDDDTTFTQPRGSNSNNDTVQQGHVSGTQKGLDDLATTLYHDAFKTIRFQGDEEIRPVNLMSAGMRSNHFN